MTALVACDAAPTNAGAPPALCSFHHSPSLLSPPPPPLHRLQHTRVRCHSGRFVGSGDGRAAVQVQLGGKAGGQRRARCWQRHRHHGRRGVARHKRQRCRCRTPCVLCLFTTAGCGQLFAWDSMCNCRRSVDDAVCVLTNALQRFITSQRDTIASAYIRVCASRARFARFACAGVTSAFAMTLGLHPCCTRNGRMFCHVLHRCSRVKSGVPTNAHADTIAVQC
jgi:hypothetical protein